MIALDVPSPVEAWAAVVLGPGVRTLFTVDSSGNRETLRAASEADALDKAFRHHGRDVWVGMARLRDDFTVANNRRGTFADVESIHALWLDLDIAGPGHKTQHRLAADVPEAQAVIASFHLPPTCIVHTGGGLHAYWALIEPLERDEAVDVLARWGEHWQATGERMGVHVDSIFDLTRIMRVPGTSNHKTDTPRPVEIIDADWTNVYNPSDLTDHLAERVRVETPSKALAPVAGDIGPGRPGDDFAARHTCGEVLAANGWVLDRTNPNGDQQWRRPGKDRRQGTSATVFAADGRCVIWTDAIPGLSPRDSLNPYRLWAKLEHGGDFSAASKDLAGRGYGERYNPDTSWVDVDAFNAPAEAPTDWDPPIPLGESLSLPPFPVDALPAWIADQARATAQAIQVSPDLPAQLGLVALAAACAKKVKVQIRKGWEEHVNLYVAIALPPSAGKSPAYRAMIGPLQAYEEQLRQDSAERVAEAEQRRRIVERRMKAKEDSPVPGDDEEARRLRLELAGLEVPAVPQLIVGDITQEALVQVLAAQGGRVALLAPEGGLLNTMLGRYSDKASLDEYLLAWGGETIKVDRIGRPSITVPEAVLTIGLTVQPVVLEGLGDPALRRKGVTARFMYSLPENMVGRRNFLDLIDAHDGAEYDARLTGLAATMQSYQSPGILTLDDEARRMFAEWRQWIEDRRGPSGELGPLDEWTGKLEASVVRVAGLLHVAERGATGAVDAATMRRALTIGAYWMEHAKAVHDLWGASPDMAKARILQRWIEEKKVSEFSVRDAHQARRKVFEKIDDMRGALEILVERLWIKPLFDGDLVLGKRGMPSPRFVVNPTTGTHGTQPIDGERLATTESQSVESHEFHEYKSRFENSVCLSVRKDGGQDSNSWNSWNSTSPPPESAEVIHSPAVEPPASAPAPHPSLRPDELGF